MDRRHFLAASAACLASCSKPTENTLHLPADAAVRTGGAQMVDIAHGLVRHATAVEGIGGLGVEADRGIEIGDGTLGVALGCIGVAPTIVTSRVIGIERD